MEALGNLGINLSYLVVQILNFFIVMLIMSFWAYKPILKVLDERSNKIAKSLEDARKAEESLTAARAEADKIISEAQAERAKIVSDATQRAETTAADIRAVAEQERGRLQEKVETDAIAYKESMLADLRPQVASLAMAAANKIVEIGLDETRQRSLIDDFFSGVVDGRVEVLEGEEIEGDAAVITSAITLKDDEKKRIGDSIMEKLGPDARVVFRVDPAILGGIVVRVGDHEIDGSARRSLETLSHSLR